MEDRQVSLKQVIDAIYETFCYAYCDNCEKEMNEYLCGDCHRKYQNWSASKKTIEKAINNLPSAQPELHYDEWCTDCKEYDQERHCCPRFNKVIRETVEEYKAEHPEPCDDAVSRKLMYELGATCMARRDENGELVALGSLDMLPSAQPDGISLEWIDKHLERLDNCDNDFAQLAKVGIRAMVEIWKKDKT